MVKNIFSKTDDPKIPGLKKNFSLNVKCNSYVTGQYSYVPGQYSVEQEVTVTSPDITHRHSSLKLQHSPLLQLQKYPLYI